MDSEHRHELKENELLEFFRNFRQWWDKHGTYVLIVIVVVLATIVLVRWLSGRAERQQAALDAEYAQLVDNRQVNSDDALLAFVQRISAEHPAIAASAAIDRGDLRLRQATIGTTGEDGLQIDPTEPTLSDPQRTLYERAGDFYQAVLAIEGLEPGSLHRLNAHMGLGAVTLELGDVAAAREHYQAVVDNAGPYHTHATAAQAMLNRDLEQLAQPVVFRLPPPEAEPATDGDADPGDADPGDADPGDADMGDTDMGDVDAGLDPEVEIDALDDAEDADGMDGQTAPAWPTEDDASADPDGEAPATPGAEGPADAAP